jgi:hypothetical protein
MKPAELQSVNHKRFKEWNQILQHQHATLWVAVGVGHDHRAGKRIVLTCQGIPSHRIVAMLEQALADLKSGGRQNDLSQLSVAGGERIAEHA